MQRYNTKDFWRILHGLLGMAVAALAAMLFLMMGLSVDTVAAVKNRAVLREEYEKWGVQMAGMNYSTRPNDGNGMQVLLTDHMGAYWENKEITCSSATYIMGKFANMLGLDWRTENTGTHSANVVIDESGEEHYVDAQPPASGNVVTNWNYKN